MGPSSPSSSVPCWCRGKTPDRRRNGQPEATHRPSEEGRRKAWGNGCAQGGRGRGEGDRQGKGEPEGQGEGGRQGAERPRSGRQREAGGVASAPRPARGPAGVTPR